MKDLWWFIALMGFLFILWLSQGRPPGEGPFIVPPYQEASAGSVLGKTTKNYSQNSSVPSSYNSDDGYEKNKKLPVANTKQTPTKPALPEKITKAKLYTRSARKTDPQKEYLEIRADYRNTENISITGWKLKSSRTGFDIAIGKGTNLVYSGQVNIQQSISLSPGDKAYIITGKSPIGTNFRLNSCTGYFEQFQDFTPSLPKRCPYPEDPPIFDFSNKCLDYVDRLPRCKMPLGYPFGTENECAEFVNQNFNYNACVKENKFEEDFLKNTWMVYLGRGQEIWPDKREIITLFNEKGEMVDQVSY